MHPDKAVQKLPVSDNSDMNSRDSELEDEFKLVTRAYKILSDDEDRRKHDANLACKLYFILFHVLKLWSDLRTDASIAHDEVDVSEFSEEENGKFSNIFFAYVLMRIL